METEEKKTKPQTGMANLERRRYPRFIVDLPIEYYRINSSIGHAGRGLSISEGGLLIYFTEEIEVDQHLRLKLFLSSGAELNTIEVMAEVVWKDIHLGKGWGDYRCGVKFIDVPPDDLAKLKMFLGGLSKS
jgi:c-di-GMP-binding flagellar brake protein YcgR